MELRLNRKEFTPQSTIGELAVDGAFACYVLEDTIRDVKVYGETAIPAGKYPVVITWSPRFHQKMPLLECVPNFEGVRIHPGNTAADTHGCLLVGNTKAANFIGESRPAYRSLLGRLQAAVDRGESIAITIGPSRAPARETAASAAKQPAWFRVTADVAAFCKKAAVTDPASLIDHLPEGAVVQKLGGGRPKEWWKVRATVKKKPRIGYLLARYLVPAPAEPPGSTTGSQKHFTVAASALRLRSSSNTSSDRNVIANLPRGHIVTRTARESSAIWWKVKTVVGRKEVEGYVCSAYLQPLDADVEIRRATPVAPGPVLSAEDFLESAGGAIVTERAFAMILEFEGLDQPGKWPGEMSGISLGIGYDLGYVGFPEFCSDWDDHLPPAQISRLKAAIGVTGQRAKALAPKFRDITIKREWAGDVFLKRTLPKFRLITAKALPGVELLPSDAQGALVSLIYNRGPGMADKPGSDRRREMREIRAAVACGDVAAIADALVRMKRIWAAGNVRGLLRRRDAEAALVRSCII